MDIKVYLVQKYFEDLENTSCKLQPKKMLNFFGADREPYRILYVL